MDEVDLNKRQARGARAEELLRNELLKECFRDLHDEYIQAWKVTHYKNAEARERLWQAVQIVGKVEQHLAKLVQNGRIATRDLSQIKTLKR
jgi:hypothetical protein